MQFIYLNTKKQILKRVLDLQEELSEYKRYYEHFRDGYKRVSKEISDQNEFIKDLERKLEQSEKELAREIFSSELEHQARMQDKDDEIKYLKQQLEHEQDAVNGYKKAYNELKEKQTKEVNFTINQINADVWKVIKAKTFPKETHKCTKKCFVEHVMPAIQRDYDSVNPKYRQYNESVNDFLVHWEKRLSENYDFIHYLYVNFDGEVKAIFKI